MAETTNIAKMAEVLSGELFSEFLWSRVGPTNTNWACEDIEKHKVKTHPSDVVFWYDNPYVQSRTYVNCDLKSYAKGTITPAAVVGAMESLSRSLSCAVKSQEWQKRFLHENVNHDVCGLLFVYNHDGEYDRNLKEIVTHLQVKLGDIPTKSKIVVLGPDDIFWLNNIRYEIVQLRGKGVLPAQADCKFFYPHLTRKKNVQLAAARAATLEMLTSPWVILQYDDPLQKGRKGYVIFYRPEGESGQECLYLIDYLMHYQVIVPGENVRIKTLFAQQEAPAVFRKAVDEYVDECDKSPDIKNRLDAIDFSEIRDVHTRFSQIELGMTNG